MPRQQKFGQEENFSRFKSFTFNIRELAVFPTLAVIGAKWLLSEKRLANFDGSLKYKVCRLALLVFLIQFGYF